MKNPAVQAVLDELARISGWKPENKAKGKCIKCSEDAIDRIHTLAGVREFEISGLCEVCFDGIFEEKGEEGDV